MVSGPAAGKRFWTQFLSRFPHLAEMLGAPATRGAYLLLRRGCRKLRLVRNERRPDPPSGRQILGCQKRVSSNPREALAPSTLNALLLPMLEKIRAIVIFCAMMLITVRMTLGPANAATMISFEPERPSASDYTQPHAEQAEQHAQMPYEIHDEAELSTDYQAEHCSSHACILGISANSYAPSDSLIETRSAGDPFASSVVPLASPEGLRRPPRA